MNPITSDVEPLTLSRLKARMGDARTLPGGMVYSGTDILEVAETTARKLKNCVDALTFAIDGWDESDPYIRKLRVTRDAALDTLKALAP
jgi:hypothetical protein